MTAKFLEALGTLKPTKPGARTQKQIGAVAFHSDVLSTAMVGQKPPKYPSPPEYLEAKAKLMQVYDEARAPEWEKYMAGKIDHATYCALIDHAWVAYANALELHWVKTGRPSNGKVKLMVKVQEEYRAKWAQTPEDKIASDKYFESLK